MPLRLMDLGLLPQPCQRLDITVSVGSTYHFDGSRTDGSTRFLDENDDKVAYLAEPVFPPVGTIVTVSDGREATVENVRLDLSNSSTLAMIYVNVRIKRAANFFM